VQQLLNTLWNFRSSVLFFAIICAFFADRVASYAPCGVCERTRHEQRRQHLRSKRWDLATRKKASYGSFLCFVIDAPGDALASRADSKTACYDLRADNNIRTPEGSPPTYNNGRPRRCLIIVTCAMSSTDCFLACENSTMTVNCNVTTGWVNGQSACLWRNKRDFVFCLATRLAAVIRSSDDLSRRTTSSALRRAQQ